MIKYPYPINITKYDDDGKVKSISAYPMHFFIIIALTLFVGVVINSLWLTTSWLLITLPVSVVIAMLLNALIYWGSVWQFSRSPEFKAAMTDLKK